MTSRSSRSARGAPSSGAGASETARHEIAAGPGTSSRTNEHIVFSHTIRTRFNEIDMQGRVSHWLVYFDEAFGELIASFGDPALEDELQNPVLASTSIEWTQPVTYRDLVEVCIAIPRTGNTSFDLSFEATVASTVVYRATSTYVKINASTGRGHRLSDSLRSLLETGRLS